MQETQQSIKYRFLSPSYLIGLENIVTMSCSSIQIQLVKHIRKSSRPFICTHKMTLMPKNCIFSPEFNLCNSLTSFLSPLRDLHQFIMVLQSNYAKSPQVRQWAKNILWFEVTGRYFRLWGNFTTPVSHRFIGKMAKNQMRSRILKN